MHNQISNIKNQKSQEALHLLLTNPDYTRADIVSRAVIDELRAAGCELEIHPQRGLRLLKTGLSVWADYLRWRDGSKRQRFIEVYGSAGSTQDVIRRLIETHGQRADGAIAAADYQSAGRGRLGRRWIAPSGAAVLFSRGCVWSNAADAPTCDQLMLATTIGLCRAIERVAAPHSLDLRIRWPNDLIVDGRKLAGILVEQITPAAIIGVGINVHLNLDELPPEMRNFRNAITSLNLCGIHVDRLAMLAEATAALDETLQRVDDPTYIDEWRQRSILLGKPGVLMHDGCRIEGDVIDLSPTDGLIVRNHSGTLIHLPGATTSLL